MKKFIPKRKRRCSGQQLSAPYLSAPIDFVVKITEENQDKIYKVLKESLPIGKLKLIKLTATISFINKQQEN